MVTLNCANTAEQVFSEIKQNHECYSEEESREYTTAEKRLGKRTIRTEGEGRSELATLSV